MEPLKFMVSLDGGIRRDSLGRSLGYEGTTGIADSVEAVQRAGLLQVPTYSLVNGRKYFDNPKGLEWAYWYDGLGEILTLKVEKSYNGVSEGLVVVDIQGAGIFMPRPQEMRKVIEGKALKNGAYPVSTEDKNLILGDRCAYRWNGTKLDVVPVEFFPSYGTFVEEAKTPGFKQKLREMTAIYAVVRPAESARENPSWHEIDRMLLENQLKNPDLAIPFGGEDQIRELLGYESGKCRPNLEFIEKSEIFTSFHDGYNNVDSGRVAVLGSYPDGIFRALPLDGNVGGRSVGVLPNAFKHSI